MGPFGTPAARATFGRNLPGTVGVWTMYETAASAAGGQAGQNKGGGVNAVRAGQQGKPQRETGLGNDRPARTSSIGCRKESVLPIALKKQERE